MTERQRLLLHVCCAPCSIAVIDELRHMYAVTVLFYNPNIHPDEEYERRKREVVKLCEEWSIPMLDEDYDPREWFAQTRGLENEPEGGKRCGVCIGMRLEHVAKRAAEEGFSIFSTTLTSGRNKKASQINPLAERVAALVGVEYLARDWKKGGREETARRMVSERGIYRQNYCGCVYSLRERDRRNSGD